MNKIILFGGLILIALFLVYQFFLSKEELKTEKIPTESGAMTEATFPDTVGYVCAGEKVLGVSLGDKIARVILQDGRNFILPQVSISDEDGAKYTNEEGKVVFSAKEDSAFLEENGTTTYAACRAS